MNPVLAAASTTATDEQLVAAIRAGSDEALAALFRRYRDRLTAYVRGIVPDHGRAEDIVQETFISALRSMRSSDREIMFRPWIYQIARNGCIDQVRRQRRAEEVSLDSDDLNPHEEGRLSEAAPSTDSRVSQREEMNVLRQALGGLPENQHEALVLRELEGRSYAEIAERMRVTPSAVESILYRARRGLKDEYDEIATGARCRRMQSVIAALAEGIGGPRDRRALARHLRHCLGCRHEAVAMGLAALVREADRRGSVRRALDRAAALFPIPPFLWRKDGSLVDRLGGRTQTAMSNLGLVGPASGEAAGALPKAIAVLVAAALIGSGGIVGQRAGNGIASSGLPSGTGPNNGSWPLADAGNGVGAPPVASSGNSAAAHPFRSLGATYDSAGSALAQPFAQSFSSTPSSGTAGGVNGPGDAILGAGPLAGDGLGSSQDEGPAGSSPLRLGGGSVQIPATGDSKHGLKLDDALAPLKKNGKKVEETTGAVPDLPPGLLKRDRPLPPGNPYAPAVPALPSPSLPQQPAPSSPPSVDSVNGAVQDVTGNLPLSGTGL